METVYVEQPTSEVNASSEPIVYNPALSVSQPPASQTLNTSENAPTATPIDAQTSSDLNDASDFYLDDPYGAESFSDFAAGDFDLGFLSYAESLDRETIWLSYTGLDRSFEEQLLDQNEPAQLEDQML